jgi:hypothetical protein
MAVPCIFTLAADLDAAHVTVRGPATGAGGGAYLTPLPGVTLTFDRADGWLSQLGVKLGPDGGGVSEEAAAWLAEAFGASTAAAVRDAPGRNGRPLALRGRTRVLRAASRLARLDAARVTSPVPASPLWDAEAAGLARAAGLSLPGRPAGTAKPASAGCAPWTDCPAAVRRLLAPRRPGSLARHRAEPGGGRALNAFLDPGLVPPRVFRPGLRPETDLLVRAGQDGSPLVTAEAPLLPGIGPADVAGCHLRLVDPARRRVLATAPLHVCLPSPTAAGAAAGPVAPSWARAVVPVTADVRALIRAGGVWAELADDERRPADGLRLRYVRRALRWADAALRAQSRPDGLAAGLAEEEWAALATLAWDRCRADWEAAGRPASAGLAATRATAGQPQPFLAEFVAVPAVRW